MEQAFLSRIIGDPSKGASILILHFSHAFLDVYSFDVIRVNLSCVVCIQWQARISLVALRQLLIYVLLAAFLQNLHC